MLYIYREYFLYLQSNAGGCFLRKCITFVEQRLKFLHFKGSTIPLAKIFSNISLTSKLLFMIKIDVKLIQIVSFDSIILYLFNNLYLFNIFIFTQ